MRFEKWLACEQISLLLRRSSVLYFYFYQPTIETLKIEHPMNYKSLFRKKSIHDIHQQLKVQGESDMHGSLGKHLGVKDLAAFGIAAIIGAGIFSTIGKASFDGGPAVIFLFIFTAIACGFAAFAYAEFASMVPVSGSA